jgi:hypothetical protein
VSASAHDAPNNDTPSQWRLPETIVELLWDSHDGPLATFERVADELVRHRPVGLRTAAQEAPAP